VISSGPHNIGNGHNNAHSEAPSPVNQLPSLQLGELVIPAHHTSNERLDQNDQLTGSQRSSQSEVLSSPRNTTLGPAVDHAIGHHPSQTSSSNALSRGIATLKALGSSIGSALCYSFTGICNQAARGETTNPALYPNPFLYCTLRSSVATLVSYFKDRKTLHTEGLATSLHSMGREGRAMCMLMALNNVLWVPAFMLTDLASAIVIACSQPFVHAVYDRIKTGKLNSRLEMASLGLSAAALSSVAMNSLTTSIDYPHAAWGNLSGFTAMLCFSAYMIINNHTVQRAGLQAGLDIPVQQTAKLAAQEKLKTVPFFSQAASALMGLGIFIPLHSGPLLSGGFGLNATNTIFIASLHGIFTASALYLRTLATQNNKPLVVSLVSNFQVGLTPTLGYLILGSSVPKLAIIAGALSFCSSLVAVAGEYQKQKPQPGPQSPEQT
jgi:hypothetical protein